MSIGDKLLKSATSALVPSENFKVVTYTGNGGTQAITGVGFKPDFVWCKTRSTSSDHNLTDSTRGVKKGLNINTSAAEGNQDPYGVTVFGDDGFTVADNSGGGAGVNGSGITYVAWCWKANGGTTTTNSDGSQDSTVQANAAAGFSIIKYTGTGSGETIGHGLSSAPKLIMQKRISSVSDWLGGALDWVKYLEPNGDPPFRTANVWGNTAPTDSVYSVVNSTSASGVDYISYVFADVAGYQKIGSYTGNASTNGPIIETDFEVGYVLIKDTTSTGEWWIVDNTRGSTQLLQQQSNSAESTSDALVTFLSNGFQVTRADGNMNGSGNVYLYLAIAVDPDEEQPTLADSFNAIAYGGNGSDNNITGYGFQPNFILTKVRDATGQWSLFDSVRGPLYRLATNTTGSGAAVSSTLTSFDADGFTFGNEAGNNSGETYIAYGFKANDDVPTFNDNGSIDSIVSVNDNAGFSIVKFTTPASPGSSTRVGHGLSSAPDCIIMKRTDGTEDWYVYHTSMGTGKGMRLNSTIAQETYTNLFNTVNATVFNPSFTGTGNMECIAYCFHDVTGYSKFGSYTGTGGDLTVTTGFQPDFAMIKRADSAANWVIVDSVRDVGDTRLYPNLTNAEDTGQGESFVSTGFKPRTSSTADTNISGGTYIYMAFKKNVASNTTLANSFKAVTWTGNGNANRTITGVGFNPDLLWIKARSTSEQHYIYDKERGPFNYLHPNLNSAQATDTSTRLKEFNSDGFKIGNELAVNQNGETFVAWAWKAGNTWQSNIDGTIPSIVNVNTANGFSIVKWNGDGSASATVGHNLSSKPDMVIIKDLSEAGGWNTAHVGLASNEGIGLESNAGAFTSMGNNGGITYANLTATTFGFATGAVGVNSVNKSGNDYIAYCWHSVSGYSKFGSYSGSGSDGNAVSLGFQPDFVMIKRTNSTGGWLMFDSARNTSNPRNNRLEADSSSAATTGSATKFLDFNSTDFEANGSDTEVNASGSTYIYMAFKAN